MLTVLASHPVGHGRGYAALPSHEWRCTTCSAQRNNRTERQRRQLDRAPGCRSSCVTSFVTRAWCPQRRCEDERLRRAEMSEAEQISWDAYTKCDPRPDATSDRELNTYLSLSTDQKVGTKPQSRTHKTFLPFIERPDLGVQLSDILSRLLTRRFVWSRSAVHACVEPRIWCPPSLRPPGPLQASRAA